MGVLTIGSFPSLVGSMTLDFTFKLAEAAIAKGHHVNVWLSGNAVMMSKKGQKAFKDYSHLQKRMNELIAKGMEITVCEACAEARGYHKEDTPEGMKRASMDWYLAETVKTDKLLHIGGE
ncbi:MAG TPA: DsrE family protein [Nitrospirota bacterium]|nr:DsrE family protein [Nitrospirota bacterium]